MKELERPPACPSDLTFDLYLGGELNQSQRERFETHRDGCDRCQHRQRSLDAQHTAFIAQAGSMSALALLTGSGERPKHTVAQPWRIALAAGTALTLAASFLLMFDPTSGPPRRTIRVERGRNAAER